MSVYTFYVSHFSYHLSHLISEEFLMEKKQIHKKNEHETLKAICLIHV